MAYQKGDEKGYFTRIIAALAVIALVASVFAYALSGAVDTSVEKDVEVNENGGVTTVDPSDEGVFPTTEPPVPIQ